MDADDFAAHGTLHVGDFFRPLVNEQHDESHLRMIGRDRVGDVLQQHRFTGAGRGNDEPALALSDRREQIHHAPREILARGFELQPVVGIERRQIVEEDLVARFLGRFEVDRVDFDQREITLAFFRRANLTGDGIACAQIEAADLRRRDVNVVRAGQVVVLGSAQEAEAVGQALENAFGEDEAALLRLGLQDLENELLFAQIRRRPGPPMSLAT